MTNQPLLKFNSKDFRIVYRAYEPADSEQAIALEEEASQHFNLFGLVGGGSIFGGDYDTKCRKFPDHIILLAEAVDNEMPEMKRVCACACLGIKEMYSNPLQTEDAKIYVSEIFKFLPICSGPKSDIHFFFQISSLISPILKISEE